MNTTTYLLCDLAAKSAILALLGLGSLQIVRRASPAWRAFAWTCVIVAIGALPVVEQFSPKIPLPWLHQHAPPSKLAAATEVGQHIDFSTEKTASAGRIEVEYASWFWGLGSFVTVSYIAAGCLALSSRKRRSCPADLLEDVTAIAKALRISRAVSLLESDSVKIPMTWGWLRPVILLPPNSGDWSPDLRRQVLLHELAHIRRNDWLTQILIRLICAAYWWNPLVWICARQWRVACEEACDSLVLTHGIRPSDYATNLLAMAVRVSGLPFSVLAMAQPSRLNQRIKGILDGSARRGPISAIGKAAVTAAAILSCTVIAGLASTTVSEPIPVTSLLSNFSFPSAKGRLQISARQAESKSDNTLIAYDVKVTGPDLSITANEIRIDKTKNELTATGNVSARLGAGEVVALDSKTEIVWHFETDRMEVHGPHKMVFPNSDMGSENLTILPNAKKSGAPQPVQK